MDQMEERRELERKIEQASRIAARITTLRPISGLGTSSRN